MADLKRSTKPVSQWTSNELLAFNIRVEDAGVEAFFNIPQLPTPTVSTTILDNFDKSHLNLCRTATVYKRSAEEPPSSIDLSLFLLNLLEYVTIGHSLHGLWAKLSFLMAGQRIIARIDLFLKSVDGLHEYLLIFHEDNVSCLNHTFLRLACTIVQCQHSNQDPEAQVIAKAIIAFDHNNCQRVKSGLQCLPAKDICAIVMKFKTHCTHLLSHSCYDSTC